MSIGTRLRSALKARNVSIRALHKSLQGNGLPGTSYPALHRYLKDQVQPPADFVAAVVTVLRVRPEWLLLGSGPALEEDWEREQQRERERAGMALVGRVEDPFGDFHFIGGLPLGGEHVRWAHYNALRRFARRLYDAGASQQTWAMEDDRRALLAAAARFLVEVDDAFAKAGSDPEARDPSRARSLTFRSDLLLQGSSSSGWQGTWADAVLDLFARRVIGLGERDPENFWDAHSPAAGRGPDLSF